MAPKASTSTRIENKNKISLGLVVNKAQVSNGGPWLGFYGKYIKYMQ